MWFRVSVSLAKTLYVLVSPFISAYCQYAHLLLSNALSASLPVCVRWLYGMVCA